MEAFKVLKSTQILVIVYMVLCKSAYANEQLNVVLYCDDAKEIDYANGFPPKEQALGGFVIQIRKSLRIGGVFWGTGEYELSKHNNLEDPLDSIFVASKTMKNEEYLINLNRYTGEISLSNSVIGARKLSRLIEASCEKARDIF
jgi:hypothetical protein